MSGLKRTLIGIGLATAMGAAALTGAVAGGGAVYWAVRDRLSPTLAAAQAGLRQGDILTAIGGQAISGERPFINVLLSFRPGESVAVTYVRNGQTRSASVTLGERPRA